VCNKLSVTVSALAGNSPTCHISRQEWRLETRLNDTVEASHEESNYCLTISGWLLQRLTDDWNSWPYTVHHTTQQSNAQNPLDTFPRNFPVDAPTYCGLVSDTPNYLDMSRCRQQVRNKLAKSRCNGICEKTRHNRHNGLFCPRQLVTYLLRGNLCNGFWP